MDITIISEYDAMRDLSSKPFRSVCYAPWTSLVFDSIGRVRACCVNFHYVLGDISKERLDDIWNGPRIAEFRDTLKNYDMYLGCEHCEFKLNNGAFRTGKLNDSTLMTMKYERFTIESSPPYWPKHMEFHLSNRCNLECVTCFGEFSSGIRKNREKLPPYPMVYDDQFFEDITKYLPHLEWTQFLGGEPFIIPEMQRIWNMLIEMKLSPHCHITTNGTVWGSKVERILDNLPVGISVSMDGMTKETFEAIRENAKFERVCENLRRFREVCHRRKQWIAINFTLSRFNWRELPNMLLFAEDEGVDLHILDLFYPESMSLYGLVPQDLKTVLQELERRADEIRPRLSRLGPTLDAKLNELRHKVLNPQGRAPYHREEQTPLLDLPVDHLIKSAFAQIKAIKDKEEERENARLAEKEAERQREIEREESRRQAEEEARLREIARLEEERLREIARLEEEARLREAARIEEEKLLELERIEAERISRLAWSVFVDQANVPTIVIARERLFQWCRHSPIDCITTDESDQVISVASDQGGLLEDAKDAVGASLQGLIHLLGSRLGEQFELVQSNDDPANYFRIVRFTNYDHRSTLVHSIFVPRHDDSGELVGLFVLLARQIEHSNLSDTHQSA